MEVIAQGEPVRQSLQCRSFFLLRVIKTHLVAFAEVALHRRHRLVIQIVGRHDEGEQIVETSGGIGFGGICHAAVGLLPRLIEPMGHIARVVIVADVRALQNKRPIGQYAGVGDAGVDRVGRQHRESGGQDGVGQRVEVRARINHRELRQEGRHKWRTAFALCNRRSIGVGLRHLTGAAVRCFGRLGRADVVLRLRLHHELLSKREIRAGRAVLVDDALGENIRYGLVLAFGLVDTERMVGTAVFADQDDDVLDGRLGLYRIGGVIVLCLVVGKSDCRSEQREGHYCTRSPC